MTRELVKVFAAFSPVEEACREALERAARGAVGCDEPWLFREDGLVRISWAGIWFPLEDALDALRMALPPEAEGKLDYLDLEAWTLTRCLWRGGAFDIQTRGLNHVLEYSGH
ncbi:conserved hypothetical protein [uncultured delta proteobacterium]|uniref:Uncharacterized protein n=1 Tax=uncultured delta proteobacterium TaxID=34034 RepID=A0A212JL46_9DELT|nr:conserved hypothetical protein [uncultured delta proteobacterium]